MDHQKVEYDEPAQGIINYNPGLTIDVVEKITILYAMKHFSGNKTQAARALNIAITTLDRKLETYREERINRELEARRIREHQNEVQRRLRGLPPGANVEQPYVFEAGQGLRFQSASEVTEKQSLPVPEREEVQEVLPQKAVANSSRKSGKRVPKANEAVKRALAVQDSK